jgi:hypothetical protein
MELLHAELDKQAAELTRIARGIDAAIGAGSRVELQLGRLFQLSSEQFYAEVPAEVPLGWPDDRIKALVRVSAQERGFLYLAEKVDSVLDGDLGTGVQAMLTAARESMPMAIEVKFREAPLVYTPGAMERDYSELVFETHSEILLLLQEGLESVEAKMKADGTT